jgi:leucyl-tRNA synthetase
VRDRVEVASDASEEELVAQARSSARVQEFLDGREIQKEIVVPGKLVNLVIG